MLTTAAGVMRGQEVVGGGREHGTHIPFVKSARDDFLVPGRDPFPWIVVARLEDQALHPILDEASDHL
jgi:hypothetical protein